MINSRLRSVCATRICCQSVSTPSVGSLDDDEWHYVEWSGNGTTWRINVDGTSFTDADSEVTVNIIAGTPTQALWWGFLPSIDRVCIGNTAAGASPTVGWRDGEIAWPTFWRRTAKLPSDKAILRMAAQGGLP